MKTIKELLFGSTEGRIIEQAKETFQVEEFDGNFWLTYNGALICPTYMFTEEPLTALAKIRELYVKRNTTE